MDSLPSLGKSWEQEGEAAGHRAPARSQRETNAAQFTALLFVVALAVLKLSV